MKQPERRGHTHTHAHRHTRTHARAMWWSDGLMVVVSWQVASAYAEETKGGLLLSP
jgi:hypothetical protein